MEVWQLVTRIRLLRRNIHFWWPPGHEGIPGNERADVVAKSAENRVRAGTEEFQVSRGELEGLLGRWYQNQTRDQKGTRLGTVLEPTEEVIIHTEFP